MIVSSSFLTFLHLNPRRLDPRRGIIAYRLSEQTIPHPSLHPLAVHLLWFSLVIAKFADNSHRFVLTLSLISQFSWLSVILVSSSHLASRIRTSRIFTHHIAWKFPTHYLYPPLYCASLRTLMILHTQRTSFN